RVTVRFWLSYNYRYCTGLFQVARNGTKMSLCGCLTVSETFYGRSQFLASRRFCASFVNSSRSKIERVIGLPLMQTHPLTRPLRFAISGFSHMFTISTETLGSMTLTASAILSLNWCVKIHVGS